MSLWKKVRVGWQVVKHPRTSWKLWRELRRVRKGVQMDKEWWKSKTIISSIVRALAMGLVLFGIIDEETSTKMQAVFGQAWEHVAILIGLVMGLIADILPRKKLGEMIVDK